MFFQKINFKKSLPVLIYLFIFLITCEITLRFTHPLPSFCKIDLFSFGAEYSLSPNQKLIYVPKPNSGAFNAYGHRGVQHEFEKTDKKRIAVIGDSVVEGHGMGVGSRFTEILGNKLGDQYEVINLGVKGYNLLQEVEYFKLIGAKFSLDIVLWCITHNDLFLGCGEIENINMLMQTMERNSFYKEYYRVKSQIEKIMLHSYLYSYIRYCITLLSKKNFRETAYYEINKNEMRDLLKQLKNLSKSNGFKLVFIFLPVNTLEDSDKIQVLKDVVKSEGVVAFDLDKDLYSIDKKELFFEKDTCHLNKRGHQEVAEVMYRILKTL